MKKLGKNKLIKNYVSFLIPLFIIEIMFRSFEEMAIFDWAVFRIFIGCNIFALLVSSITCFMKESIGRIVSILVLLVATIYAILQAGFENFLGVYISIGTSSQLGAVTEYIQDYFASFNPSFWWMLLPFVLFVLYKCFLEKKIFVNLYKEEESIFTKRASRRSAGIAIVCAILLFAFYYQTLSIKFMQNELQLESTKSLFKNPTNLNISVNQFGTSMFGILDVKSTLFKTEDNEMIDFGSGSKRPTEVTDYTRMIDDTAWETLQSETTNSNYKTLNSYFMSRTIADKNEYTGMFEDKNLIVIMTESVNEVFINPEYYPTFYKMYTEGFSWENNYSPRNSCATGNNEMSGMVSLFSINRICTANQYKNNKYNESIFGLFNKAGYTTSSYHNYDETYYFRSTIHKNMGSSAFYGVKDLKIPYTSEYKEWPSDILLMEHSMEHIDTTKPFMAWMTSVTSHQPYYVSSEYGDKYVSMFKNTGYSNGTKRYMSKLKELDLALARLLELLEEKGVLEDTVIVLYGDHYPYGLKDNDVASVLPDALERNNIEQTPFVIYNSEMEGKHFTEYTSYLNILPTIANLFNLEYDPRLYMGEDILASDYATSYKNRVVFADGSWENEIGYYNSTTGKMNYFGETKYTNEEIIKFNKEISNMIKMSNLAITSNYFKYLSEGLEKYQPIVEPEETNETEN